MTLVVVIAWCALAIFGDLQLKNRRLLPGFVVYALCALPSYFVFARQDFGWVTVVWAAVSVPVGLAVAIYFYHEPLTVKRIIGAVLAISAIALMEAK